ncbi:MAG TPA: MFS transporter [Kofleriaceae bacterium]|jgi:putative MFS transporter|nr:MFS transporter [Kofleriaceae bacterium]
MTQPRQLSEADLDILRRIERLPFGRFQWRLLWMGGLGYTFDALDGALIGFILTAVTALWKLSSHQTGVMGSSGMIGYLFGAFFAGALGDLIGRRTVMMYALAVYSVATLIAAFATSWHMLFWWRLAASVGTGAESAIIAPFLAEFVQKRVRGRFIGSLAGFFSYGWVLAALLGYLVIPRWSDGWRIVQLISALPIVMLLWWRRSLPESPRWLLERGRSVQARAEVERIEAELTRHGRTTLPSLDSVEVPAESARRGGSFLGNLAALWSRPVRRTTIMLWLLWIAITFSYYGFFTWIPSLLVKQGMTITRSFGYSIIIYLAQIPGYYSAAFVSEKLDRKWTIVVYMVLGGVSAYLLSMARTDTSITTAGVLLSFCMNGTYAGIYAYTPELYPTAFRTTGMGVASAFGRLGGLSAPIIIGNTYDQIGFAGVFGITTVVLVAGALAVAALGIATAGKSLEQITAEALRPAER